MIGRLIPVPGLLNAAAPPELRGIGLEVHVVAPELRTVGPELQLIGPELTGIASPEDARVVSDP